MRKLEIGPNVDRSKTPDGEPTATWHTTDSQPGCTMTCRWGEDQIPAPTSFYDWIHASHVLEHVPWWRTQGALREVYRILKPEGRFTVWVPNAVKIIRMALDDPEEYQAIESEWACGTRINPDRDPWVYMNARVFWGARPGEVGQEQHFHRAMFGTYSLRQQLIKAGFRDVRRIARDKSVDPGHGWMEIGMEAFK